MHLLDPRRMMISHFGVKLHLGHVHTHVLLQALHTDCAVLRVEMTLMEAKMHAMEEHILAIKQENTILKEHLARVQRAVDM